MKKTIIKIFHYLEPMWCGKDKKISLRAVLSLLFSFDFIRNLSYAVMRWDSDRSLEGLSMVLGIEAALIAALLGLTTYQNIIQSKIDSSNGTSESVV